MTEIQLFSFKDREVRTVMIDGEPWWVAKDVCDILEIGNPSEAMKRLDEADLSSTEVRSGAQNRKANIINESGLYDLILDSRKPEAKAFRKWITSEVIPSIRRTGTYGTAPQLPQSFADALQLAADQARELEMAKPAIEFHATVTADDETWLTMEQVSKEIGSATGLGRNTLINWMRGKGYLTQARLPSQQLINSGKARANVTIAANGKSYPHAVFSQAGVEWLIRKFKSDNDKD